MDRYFLYACMVIDHDELGLELNIFHLDSLSVLRISGTFDGFLIQLSRFDLRVLALFVDLEELGLEFDTSYVGISVNCRIQVLLILSFIHLLLFVLWGF